MVAVELDVLAALAALPYTPAQTHEEKERRTANLHAGLATREIIGQAQGPALTRIGVLRKDARSGNPFRAN